MDQKEYIDLDKVKNRKFSSWLEVDAFLRQLEDQTKQVYTTTKSRSIQSYKNNKLNPDLKFGWSLWTCKFAGEHKSTSSGERTTRSYKVSCGAFIKFTKTKDGQQLEITDCQLEHINHSGSEAYYHFIPEKRLLNKSKKELKEEVQGLLRLGAKKTSIQNKLCSEGRGFVAKKDLHNLASKLSAHDDDELSAAVHLLQNTYNANVSIRTVENQFKGMYFSTTEMRESMALAPEIIFCDGTYQLLKRKLTLMLLVVEDNEGASKLVGAGLLASEDKETLEWFFQMFRNENEDASARVQNIMTDKDFGERDNIRKILSHVSLLLCLFHTLRSFNRASKQMKINAAERQLALSLLEKMAKATTASQYDNIYKEFKASAPQVLLEYFEHNWHPIRNEWTKYSMVDGTFGNTTNNRIESINSKIKAELDKNNKLVDFVHSFFQWFLRRNDELDFKKAQNILRKSSTNASYSKDEIAYASLLTNYAFTIVHEEFNASQLITIRSVDKFKKQCKINSCGVQLNVTTSSCDCIKHRTMQLPCRHIFAVRRNFNLSLFDRSLCANRWMKQ